MADFTQLINETVRVPEQPISVVSVLRIVNESLSIAEGIIDLFIGIGKMVADIRINRTRNKL